MHNDLILTDARYGELGMIQNEDGSVSTEFSITKEIPELGGWVNIPTLVKGQEDLSFLETGELTEENERIAIDRARERVASGAQLPYYNTPDEAVEAAENRSEDEKMEPYIPTKKDEERKPDIGIRTVINDG